MKFVTGQPFGVRSKVTNFANFSGGNSFSVTSGAIVDNQNWEYDVVGTLTVPTSATGAWYAPGDSIGIYGRTCFKHGTGTNNNARGSNLQATAYPLRFVREGDLFRMRFGIAMATAISGSTFWAGLSAVNTSIQDTTNGYCDSTNAIGIYKAPTATDLSVEAVKASGTAERGVVGCPTLVAGTWYDVDMVFRRGASAGVGTLSVVVGGGVPPGGSFTGQNTQYPSRNSTSFSMEIATQFPDAAVDLVPSLSLLNTASTDDMLMYISDIGWYFEQAQV